jgi:hypothetical protein
MVLSSSKTLVKFVGFCVRLSKARCLISRNAPIDLRLGCPRDRSEQQKLCDGLFLNSSNLIGMNHELLRVAIGLSVKLAGGDEKCRTPRDCMARHFAKRTQFSVYVVDA